MGGVFSDFAAAGNGGYQEEPKHLSFRSKQNESSHVV